MEHVIARDPKTKEILRIADRVSNNDANVLLRGESGVGKDLLARYIHQKGRRALGPFVKIDCANIPPDLLESELFGYEKGAFTDAADTKMGRFELASHGTVLIDEVTELSPSLQAKILRIIQEKKFERLGGNKTYDVDVRIIASTNTDIEAMVDERTFRHDLYYRLNVIAIEIPPLRERPRDIVPLATHYQSRFGRQHGRKLKGFTDPARDLLLRYPWPGNIWELRNAIEQAVILAKGPEIDVPDLRISQKTKVEDYVQWASERQMSLEDLERAYIVEVLKLTGGNVGKSAEILGIHRKTLLEKRRKYGIKLARERRSPRAAAD